MKKKKILFLFNNVDHFRLSSSLNVGPVDGGTNILLNFINRLERGYEVYISTQRGNKKRYEFILNNPQAKFFEFKPFYDYIKIKISFLEILLRAFLLPFKLISQFRNVDIVVSSSDFWPDSCPALFLKMINSKIFWIAGFFLTAPPPWRSPYRGRRFLTGLFYWLSQIPVFWLVKKYADVVLVTSEPDVEKFITPQRGRNRIIVMMGGVDIKPSTKYLNSPDFVPLKKRKYDACFMGRFHYQKGVLELVDIWKEVIKKIPGAKLAMIGDGDLYFECKKKIKALHLENNIDLLGFKEGPEKYAVFKQSKIIVHPAIYDSGGMSAAEGMAWGLPGVSFDLEALKSYYPEGMIKVPCFDKKEFAEAIVRLLKDRKLYNKFARRARDLIVRNWRWDIRLKTLYEIIN